jgi:hypothetical protein
MSAFKSRGIRPAFLASISALLCLAALALTGASLGRSHPPASGDAVATVPPAVEPSISDPERAAWQVASATDTGRPTPAVPSCEEALDRPIDGRCADYEDALRDFLENAREACNKPGHKHAEDLSCVPAGFFVGLRA